MVEFKELMAAGCLGFMAGVIAVLAFFGWAFLKPMPEDDDE